MNNISTLTATTFFALALSLVMNFWNTTRLTIAVFLISLVVGVTQASAASLVLNGDFEAGDVDFNTDLILGIDIAEGRYNITTDPNLIHLGATSYGDHTTGSGLMMAVNGSSVPGELVWGQNGIVVTPNTDFDFAAYISSWFPANPASLQFAINGNVVGNLNASSTTGQWNLFFATWNSGLATTANIEIRNNTLAPFGNDFALDDIHFGSTIFSNPVPEPSTFALLGLGLAAFGYRRWKKA